ncbi:BON domain-containing protein [Rubinisphaera italica]|uniref:BON domain protein n=1 Tax=Rubinisphaera italica TaxID=2527969 RepID=A0A5C5XKP1_9PLAN|nr:BON domain-containing protein [Rubinisphaera italica]TWT62953.1 BON domain protein [Rubinisphaera italica]
MLRFLFTLMAGLLIVNQSASYAQNQNQSQNQGQTGGAAGRGVAGGGTAAGPTGGGAAATQEINTDAGSSANIEREFNEGLVGQSDNVGRFVGDEQAGTQRLNQQGPNFQQRNGSNVNGGQPTKQSKIRPVLIIAFDIPQTQFTRSRMIPVDRQLSFRMLNKPQFSGVSVNFDETGSLILNGVVNTPRDKKLAEAFARLEPGVKKIANQIVVLPQ